MILDREYLFQVVFSNIAARLMLGKMLELSLHCVVRIYPRRKIVKVILAVSFFSWMPDEQVAKH